jgi:FtsH-binding integral membrane protein
MSTNLGTRNAGVAMMVVGVVGLIVAAVWLFAMTDPFPMWLIIAGGGLLFLGTGSAIRGRDT